MDLYEFEARQVYAVTTRTARATQWDPLYNTKQQKPTVDKSDNVFVGCSGHVAYFGAYSLLDFPAPPQAPLGHGPPLLR